MTYAIDNAFDDTLGDTAVASPSPKAIPLALGGLIVLAMIGFYLGLNSGDHRTRLPGDTRGSEESSGIDLSRAKVAVALSPEEIAPPPPAPEPKVEAAPVVETAAPVAAPVVAPVIEAPPPAAAPVAGPPPNLEGLF